MKLSNIEVSRKVDTIFGKQVEKCATVSFPIYESVEDLSTRYSEEALVALVNFSVRLLAQRQANNDLKGASSGLSESDAASVKQILRFVNQAKELYENPVEAAEKILSKPKFSHLRAIFEGSASGKVSLDYSGTEFVDGAEMPILRAPKGRGGEE